ncbi:MAG: TonB-dependent receptor [Terriglobia bacterium]
MKIDHRWSDKSSLFGEWLFNPGKYNNYRTPWTGPTTPFDSVGWGSVYPVSFANQIIALGHTYVFSPTLVNEFRASFSRQFLSTNPSAPYPDSVTGWPAVKQELAPLQIPVDSFFQVPNWSMSTPGGGSLSFGPTGWLNMIQTAEAYTILDNVTKIIGKHTLKTGFVYRLDHNAYDSGFPTGFYFSGGFVQDPNTGLGANGLEQFMMGGVEANGTNSYAGIMWQPYSRFRYYGFYAQDDFHIAPRFTLNLGLRYDIFGFLKTRQEPLSNFCLGCDNPVTGLKGKMIYVGDPEWPGHGQDLYPPHYNDIAPRVNFSWAPFANRKTVVRGGYDIFYSNAFEGINQPGQSAANAPGWNQEYDWTGSFYPDQCQPFSGQCVAFPLNDTSVDKRTLNGEPTTHPAQNRDSLIGIGLIQLFPPVSHDPMVQSWNLQVQHEFPGNMQLTVGYIGNHGTHLYGRHFPYNYVHTADLLKYQTSINADVPITQVYSGKTADALQQVYGTTTLPRYVLLQQYPFYGATAPSMQSFYSFMGTSVYDALNVSLQKRTSHGLDFLIAYTNSKQITNPLTDSMAGNLVDPIHYGKSGNIGGRAGTLRLYSRFQNPDNFRVDRAVAPNDIPQILNLSASYALPFGTGKAFLNQKGIVNGVLGGWRLSGNFNAESGTPLAIDGPCDELQNAIGNFGTGMCSPDLIGNPKFSGSRSRTQQIADWINPAAFQPSFGGDQNFWADYDPNDPRAWQFGTAGPLFPQIRAPGFWNLDTGLFKDFHLREDKYFEFRWEAFNALNHQNLGLPHEGFCLSPLPDGSTDKVHRSGCSFGRITNIQTDPRSMQFSLKFFW